MTISNHMGRIGRTLAFGTAIIAGIGLATPQPAHALGTGAAIGIGLGAAALGTAVGAAATNPYYNGYYAYPAYGYGPAYGYPPPRSCWSPYYRTYVAC
jgi:hypothetical protein